MPFPVSNCFCEVGCSWPQRHKAGHPANVHELKRSRWLPGHINHLSGILKLREGSSSSTDWCVCMFNVDGHDFQYMRALVFNPESKYPHNYQTFLTCAIIFLTLFNIVSWGKLQKIMQNRLAKSYASACITHDFLVIQCNNSLLNCISFQVISCLFS